METTLPVELDIADFFIINLGWDDLSVLEYGQTLLVLIEQIADPDSSGLLRIIPEVFN
jgi:hypothetical protein